MTAERRIRVWAKEAAAQIGITESTLAKWRSRGEGPDPHPLGRRRIYYLQSEIDAWQAACDAKIPERRTPKLKPRP